MKHSGIAGCLHDPTDHIAVLYGGPRERGGRTGDKPTPTNYRAGYRQNEVSNPHAWPDLWTAKGGEKGGMCREGASGGSEGWRTRSTVGLMLWKIELRGWRRRWMPLWGRLFGLGSLIHNTVFTENVYILKY